MIEGVLQCQELCKGFCLACFGLVPGALQALGFFSTSASSSLKGLLRRAYLLSREGSTFSGWFGLPEGLKLYVDSNPKP